MNIVPGNKPGKETMNMKARWMKDLRDCRHKFLKHVFNMFIYQPKSLVFNALNFFWFDHALPNDFLQAEVGGYEDPTYKGIFSFHRVEPKGNTDIVTKRGDLPTQGYIHALIDDARALAVEVMGIWTSLKGKWVSGELSETTLILKSLFDTYRVVDFPGEEFDCLGEFLNHIRNFYIKLQSDIEIKISGEVQSGSAPDRFRSRYHGVLTDLSLSLNRHDATVTKALLPNGKILTNHFHILVGATRCSDDMTPLFDIFQVVQDKTCDVSKTRPIKPKEFSLFMNPSFMATIYKIGHLIITKRIHHAGNDNMFFLLGEGNTTRQRASSSSFETFLEIAKADHSQVMSISL